MKKLSARQFQVIIERDADGWYVGSVPALPGCHTQAKKLETLHVRLQEAIELCLEHQAHDAGYRYRIRHFAYSPTFVGMELVQV